MSKPFPKDEVIKVIEAKFKRGRFDAELDSDNESSSDDDSSEDSSSDSEADTDSDGDLSPPKKKTKKSSKSKAKKRTKQAKGSPAPAHSPPSKSALRPSPASDEVGDLIKRMSRMSIEDPDYNYLYYQATKLDPHAAECLRAPLLAVNAPPTSSK
ncbi:hypothetical protein MVEN_00066300 [Mycena venus]|uniref:Uncharacterized protein n=1 Tax=Mycena venus TaxID=2733690 RepID=A0A8H6ZAC0_9AGAR|nr:hypothetical protein MVEN_00066300 [Mycena venus]